MIHSPAEARSRRKTPFCSPRPQIGKKEKRGLKNTKKGSIFSMNYPAASSGVVHFIGYKIFHKYSLRIGAIIVTVLTVLDVCCRWNNTGASITYRDHFGNLLANEFTPYSIGIKILIYAIDIIILPLLLMLSVYALRHIFSSKNTLHYVIRLISAIILGCLLFCYCVLFGFLADLQGWQWVVGCAGFLPEIFTPIATLAIMIAAAIGMIFLLISLFFFGR